MNRHSPSRGRSRPQCLKESLMNVSKTLSSAVAAATIVGAVGLAYAQTTNDPANSARPNTTSATGSTTGSSSATDANTTSSMPQTTPAASTGSSGTSTDSSATSSTDLQPKADRN